jgi:plasmid maintenance system antidote protein VapI
MTIQDALCKSDMSIYRLAKVSKVPYATVNDVVNRKTDIRKCSVETIYRLSQALKVPTEELIESYM